ncbi:hypothetical protein CsSME_00008191 [Camellia sinensis var. sinensis]
MAKCILFLSLVKRHAIFAMSNPTMNAECTAVDAFNHAGENISFCNPEPFQNVDLGMGMIKWVMIGMRALLSGARLISDGMSQAASECYWFNF